MNERILTCVDKKIRDHLKVDEADLSIPMPDPNLIRFHKNVWAISRLSLPIVERIQYKLCSYRPGVYALSTRPLSCLCHAPSAISTTVVQPRPSRTEGDTGVDMIFRKCAVVRRYTNKTETFSTNKFRFATHRQPFLLCFRIH